MIASAQTIRKLCSVTYKPMITPFAERTIFEGMSYGVSAAGYDIRIKENLIIYPNEFVLASTMEHFNVPNHLLIVVHDKSSWARRGIFVQNTVFEPGWSGYATLELTNNGIQPIQLKGGMPIAQVIMHYLDEASEQPYAGKYQNQKAGPQPAIIEKV